jgi:divalent metal cation (Fe/Co/Zn/Cd) transporter
VPYRAPSGYPRRIPDLGKREASPVQLVPAGGCCGHCDCDCGAVASAGPVGAGWLRSARYARWLAWASLAWMTAEGVLGLLAGFGAGSVALVGWALGSVIEALASIIVVWRFTGSRVPSETAERRAQKAVAVSFWLLAPYVAVQAAWDLARHHHASPTALGIALTASSVAVMPALGIMKRRLGARLSSGATAGEGIQNLMCAAQAAAVLAGWSVWEGTRSWRGDNCC